MGPIWLPNALIVIIFSILVYQYPSALNFKPLYSKEVLCPLPEFVDTLNHEKTQLILHDSAFRKKTLDRFSRAIQIDTTIDEKMNDFTKFEVFHNYLETEFPIVFEKAKVTKINTYGLLFEVEGENPALKPAMFMAHQDTVPIGDIKEWKFDPLGGFYDDKRVYGRGTNDVKGLLVGLMNAVETIFTDYPDHKFQRGFKLAFGFDEEISGNMGAKKIGEYLLEQYGPNTIDHIIDEGAPMFLELKGTFFGPIVTSEKGYMDMRVEVTTPGGHSSNPRDTTSIGILSRFLESYERDKFPASLPNSSPMLKFLECNAEHHPSSKFSLKDILLKLSRANELAKRFIVRKLEKIKLFEYTIRTSQAIDVIYGGEKYNSLPPNATAIINHRITIGDTFDTIWEKAIKHAVPAAEFSNVGLIVNNVEIIPATKNGVIKIGQLEKNGDMLPAPITPAYDDKWNRLTSYIRTFYEKEVYPEKLKNSTYIISPTSMQGNTDTRHYWKLTDHIYRVQPGITNLFEANMHGSNEYVDIETHMQVVAFYYNYILGIC